jgi:hypothetical protein
MKPLLSIATHIDVGIKQLLNALTRLRITRIHAPTLVVSPHVLGSFACFLLLAPAAFGTSGIVIVTSDYVIIGADSAVAHSGRTTGITQQCKIIKEGSTFFFISGEYTAVQIGLDSYALAREAVTKGKTIEGAIHFVEERIPSYIPALVAHTKFSSPDVYARWRDGVPIISIVFASLEDGDPIAGIVNFRIDAAGNPMIPNERRIMRSAPGQIQVMEFASHLEMDRIIDNVPKWRRTWSLSPAGAVQSLIQAEIDASTREKRFDVGGPISILLISRDFSGMERGYEGKCQ